MSDLSYEEMAAMRKEILSSLHSALPGRVEDFDSAACTATIRIMLKSRSGVSMPLLRDVPVFLPTLNDEQAFDIVPGDFCLVIFADNAIDAWLQTGEESIPVSGRCHDLSDAFAFVGFHPGGGA
jgi:hypothetical protein